MCLLSIVMLQNAMGGNTIDCHDLQNNVCTDWISRLSIRSELIDKPNSVVDNHSSRPTVACRFKRPTRIPTRAALGASYLALLRVGFTLPLPLPATRCALTAPFHPYQHDGGIFSVALAVGSRLPGVTWHSALWSPDFPLQN